MTTFNKVAKRKIGAALIGAAALFGAMQPASATMTPNGIWLSNAEIAKLPMTGEPWKRVKAAADGALGKADISDQDNKHDVNTLAAALVYARTGTAMYRVKAADGIMSIIGTEKGGRTLALGRNLVSYVIAADLIDLRAMDATREAKFRDWLDKVRFVSLEKKTLISTHEDRPNNWGTHAGASRIAAALYLNDKADLQRAAMVFKGWLGDRTAYSKFKWDDDMTWHVNAKTPVGINPKGAMKAGKLIDGSFPDDMRRGCSFKWMPCETGYAWGAMEGASVQTALLQHAGFDAIHWSDNAIFRATMFLHKLDQEAKGKWWAEGDDTWQPYLINRLYGSNFPVETKKVKPGKNMAWTDWTHGS